MSEIKEIIEELKNIHGGNAWHGASLKDALEGIAYEQAAAHPLKNAHSVWEIVAHIEGWEGVFRRRLEGQEISEPETGDFPDPAERSETAWTETLNKLETRIVNYCSRSKNCPIRFWTRKSWAKIIRITSYCEKPLTTRFIIRDKSRC